ncbi:MAG: 30S ribosomal protein S6 [Candidatus Marinimicrobia bacterium]|jgi:small subunit ribosomal protein S6|nr:30S ribosomal protein S6 [Candidatus Neomarinimicrobiota bacterium]
MRYYETLYIVNPSFENDQVTKIIDSVTGELESNKIKVINHYVWGKKHLAYPIQKHRYGNYIIIHFESENRQFLLDFDSSLKLNNSIMRHQTVRLDVKPDVVVQEEIIAENEMVESEENLADQEGAQDKPIDSESSDDFELKSDEDPKPNTESEMVQSIEEETKELTPETEEEE